MSDLISKLNLWVTRNAWFDKIKYFKKIICPFERTWERNPNKDIK